MEARRVADILKKGQPEEIVIVKGWVRTKRELKGFAFAEVNDGSSLASLQLVIDQSIPDYDTILKKILEHLEGLEEGHLLVGFAKDRRRPLFRLILEPGGVGDLLELHGRVP